MENRDGWVSEPQGLRSYPHIPHTMSHALGREAENHTVHRGRSSCISSCCTTSSNGNTSSNWVHLLFFPVQCIFFFWPLSNSQIGLALARVDREASSKNWRTERPYLIFICILYFSCLFCFSLKNGPLSLSLYPFFLSLSLSFSPSVMYVLRELFSTRSHSWSEWSLFRVSRHITQNWTSLTKLQ